VDSQSLGRIGNQGLTYLQVKISNLSGTGRNRGPIASPICGVSECGPVALILLLRRLVQISALQLCFFAPVAGA
jgi:hypothetical protein